jgi:hypothetical protein
VARIELNAIRSRTAGAAPRLARRGELTNKPNRSEFLLMPRCAWTLEESDRAKSIEIGAIDGLGRNRGPVSVHVLPEHETALRAYAERARKTGHVFTMAVAGLTVGMIAAGIAGSAGMLTERDALRTVGVLLASLGALLYALPFTTPQTAHAFGIRQSVRIARTIAVFTVVVGLVMVFRG